MLMSVYNASRPMAYYACNLYSVRCRDLDEALESVVYYEYVRVVILIT